MAPIFGVSPGGNGDSIVAARNVMSFGAIGDGVTDDTAAIQRGLDAIANGGSLYIPPGKSFLIKSPNPAAFAPALTLRGSNCCLFGEGPSSEIFVDDTGAAAGGTRVQTYDALRIDGACSNVLIQNLQFRGRKTDFIVWPYNADDLRAQQAAIADRSLPSTSHDIIIRGVSFRQLFSHCVRTGHAGEHHWRMEQCTVFQCTNGMNACGDDVVYDGGSVISANGIETVGDRARIIGVTIQDGSGITVGGSGAQIKLPHVVGCHLKNITVGGGGIGFAGVDRGLISGCVIDDVATGLHGIFIDDVGAFGTPSGPITISGNIINVVSGNHGIWVHGSAGGTRVVGNDIVGVINGLLVQCPNVTVSGNRLSAPGHTDLNLADITANGVRVTHDNVLVNGAFFNGGATVGRVDFVSSGAPPGGLTPPNGSTYTRTDGAAGTTFYVRVGGAWVGVA